MPATATSAGRETEQLRELITTDRSDAGELRNAERRAPLRTVAYRMPLHVQVKRRWRMDKRLRVTSFGSAFAALALLALSLWPRTLSPSVHATETSTNVRPEPSFRTHETRAAAVAHPATRSADVAGPTQEAREVQSETPSRFSSDAGAAAELSPQRRLQRADLWLSLDSERGARTARALLESALGDRPRSAHGHAALAAACLQLGDESCARSAIKAAMAIRPWRAGYRVLARRIDAAFAR